MNNNLKIGDKEFTPYLSAPLIEQSIKNIAQKINESYANSTEPIVLLITLSGAMMFAAELSKHLSVAVEWAFVKCSSYGDATTSSGVVKCQLAPTQELKGRDVIVVEDIIDTGNTWEFLYNEIQKAAPKSLKIASLTIKRTAYSKKLPIDFVALEIEDKFVIGYGLDYGGLGRHLNGIYVVTSC